MFIQYNPVVIYLFTLFICLGLLIKALRDMCQNQEQEEDDNNSTEYQGARKIYFILRKKAYFYFHKNYSALITPEVYVIPINRSTRRHNNYNDNPPTYDDAITPPPSYEECLKDNNLRY